MGCCVTWSLVTVYSNAKRLRARYVARYVKQRLGWNARIENLAIGISLSSQDSIAANYYIEQLSMGWSLSLDRANQVLIS